MRRLLRVILRIHPRSVCFDALSHFGMRDCDPPDAVGICQTGACSALLGAVLNKGKVLGKIVERLEEEVALYLRAARTAAAEATDEQSKAENKYDTRGLEASYLARGQSRQAAETEQALVQFRALTAQPLPEGAAVDVGALVEVVVGRSAFWYLVGPRAGGTEVECDGHEVTVITPQSPLGLALVGRSAGARFKFPTGSDARIRTVL